jgi:hypothetical protein
MAINNSCWAQQGSCDTNRLNEKLTKIEQRDQEVRMQFLSILDAFQKDGSKKLKFISLALKMQRADKKNQAFLLEMLEQCGWSDALNKEAHNTVFLVLQHSPDSIMENYFPMVQTMVLKNLLAPDNEAMMYDRLQMNAGLPQKYGSQAFSDTSNVNYIWPIEQVDSVDFYRASVKLPSMQQYLKITKDSTGIEFIWDKSLTIQKANETRSGQ